MTKTVVGILFFAFSSSAFAIDNSCPNFLRGLAPLENKTISLHAVAISRARPDLRALMIEAVDLILNANQDPHGQSLMGVNQAESAHLYALLGLSSDEIQQKISARLFSFLRFADSLIEKTKEHDAKSRNIQIAPGVSLFTSKPLAAMSENERAAFDQQASEMLDQYNRSISGYRALVEASGLDQKYGLSAIKASLLTIPQVNSTTSSRSDYLASLSRGFLMAIEIRDNDVAYSFLQHMIRSGNLALAARAAYVARNEEVLMQIALLALGDYFIKIGFDFSRNGSAIEIAIESLAVIEGDLMPKALEILQDLGVALPKIYEDAIRQTEQGNGLKYAIVDDIKRLKDILQKKNQKLGRHFFTDLRSVDFSSTPIKGLEETLASQEKEEASLKTEIKKFSEESETQRAEWSELGEAALLREDYKTAYKYFSSALDIPGLLNVLRSDLAGRHGYSALCILRVIVLIEEFKRSN